MFLKKLLFIILLTLIMCIFGCSPNNIDETYPPNQPTGILLKNVYRNNSNKGDLIIKIEWPDIETINKHKKGNK